MSQVASLAQGMVREAARPIAPGETVKAQLRKAARALGYSDGDWRIRAAWYGEAGSWSAASFVDLQTRFRAWREKQEGRARAEAAAQIARLSATAEALRAIDPDFHCDTIAALKRAISGARVPGSPVAGTGER